MNEQLPPNSTLEQTCQHLRAALATDEVVTAAQLQRWGWWAAAQALELPSLTRTCRVRVTDPESGRDLRFLALDRETLSRAPRDLMHLAGLAEARRRLALEPGETWRLLNARGAAMGDTRHWPDAEIVQQLDNSRRSDWAVEFDAGYSRARIRQKLQAAATAGFTRLYWASSIHTRVETVLREMLLLKGGGTLPRVTRVETRFVDFWSRHDPYVGRPRCHKSMGRSRHF